MERIFKKTITITQQDVNSSGKLKLSSLLHYAQEISGNHSDQLGFNWDTLASRDLFWAVLRHRVTINRLPSVGETVYLETWPIPATRAAYPRCVRAMDSQGNTLFETISLWVFMNIKTRAMVLPGKSGVDVPGVLRGDEPSFPGSLPPAQPTQSSLWQVDEEDLDINGHVNNARYLDHVENLPDFIGTPRELTVCYLAEALLGQAITLSWNMTEEGILTVEGARSREDQPDKTERVFAVKLCCSVNQTEL